MNSSQNHKKNMYKQKLNYWSKFKGKKTWFRLHPLCSFWCTLKNSINLYEKKFLLENGCMELHVSTDYFRVWLPAHASEAANSAVDKILLITNIITTASIPRQLRRLHFNSLHELRLISTRNAARRRNSHQQKQYKKLLHCISLNYCMDSYGGKGDYI